jgi:hypothetical protein
MISDNSFFRKLSEFWVPDGSLREVYFTDTSLEDWVNFIRFIQGFQHQYSYDHEAQPVWPVEQIFANREAPHLLSINIGGIFINCHFFIAEEIELDIDPREVTGPAQHHAILEFIAAMAKALQRSAVLTRENEEVRPFLTFTKFGTIIHSPNRVLFSWLADNPIL